MKPEKITFSPDGEETVDFYVLEQTKIAGVNYILVTDFEDGDGEALILKDLSKAEDTESVYEIVSDEKELEARRSASFAPKSTPSTKTTPGWERSRPFRWVISVDLPLPVCPMMPTNSPSSMDRLTAFSARASKGVPGM